MFFLVHRSEAFILKVLVANYEVSCEFVDRCNNYIIVVGED